MKYLITAVITLLAGLLIGSQFLKTGDNISRKEEADIIVNKIEEVNKLISLEGNFAEVYTLDQTQKLFFDLIPIPKKAIIVADAKVYVAYDLTKMNYSLDQETKTVHLKNIPPPQIIVEPELEFYDLKANILPFTKEELTILNERATTLLREEAEKKEFLDLAEKNLALNLQQIIVTANQYGWDVEQEMANPKNEE